MTKKNGVSISVSWHLFAQGTAQLCGSPRLGCQKCNAEDEINMERQEGER